MGGRTRTVGIVAPLLLAAGLLAMTAGTLAPYGGNPTALFHMDRERATMYAVPPGFVTLEIPGYDSMQYYAIARNMGTILLPWRWSAIAGPSVIAYSYQRILLPTAAFAASLGHDALLPWAFLGINLVSLFLAGCLLLKRYEHPLYGFALAFCPAAMVGFHFSLAEPLTLLVFTAALLRLLHRDRVTWVELLLLSAFVLAREVNILFIAFLCAFFLWRGRWREALLLLVPAAVFLGWHSAIYQIFGEMPFLWSAEKRALPGQAILEILLGAKGWNPLTLSSVALFAGVVLPATILAARETWRTRACELLPAATLAFLFLMFIMPDHIWGSITSIGRVITPVYPLTILLCARRDDGFARALAAAILGVGLAAGIGLASIVHPFTLS